MFAFIGAAWKRKKFLWNLTRSIQLPNCWCYCLSHNFYVITKRMFSINNNNRNCCHSTPFVKSKAVAAVKVCCCWLRVCVRVWKLWKTSSEVKWKEKEKNIKKNFDSRLAKFIKLWHEKPSYLLWANKQIKTPKNE